MKNRIYIQSEYFADVKLIEVDDDSTLEELKKACLELLPKEAEGEDIQLFVEDEDEEYRDQSHIKVEHIKKPHGIRVHLHRCRHIAVTVRFAGQAISHKFQPAATIGYIRNWAGRKLNMQPDDIAEHVLQIAGGNEQPDVDVHVGTLAKCPDCSVEMDLVPAHRING